MDPCMDVEFTFSGFLLQNAFIQAKIWFIGHITVHLNIILCRSFGTEFFNNTATAFKHSGSFYFGSVYICRFYGGDNSD